MRILIATASRHSSTAAIGSRIGDRLRERGHDVEFEVADADRWLDDEHDAYIIGSAVYMGNWVRGARRFVEANAAMLSGRRVWMFSSGPLGDQPGVGITTGHLEQLTAKLGPRSHRVFHGCARHSDLNPFERLVMRLVRAPYGDFRNWGEIDRWAGEIAAELEVEAANDVHAAGRVTPGG
jgi:menaquinone-dependent protoporphyrinogen oxidase